MIQDVDRIRRIFESAAHWPPLGLLKFLCDHFRQYICDHPHEFTQMSSAAIIQVVFDAGVELSRQLVWYVHVVPAIS